MATPKLLVEYAKTNRSSCKICSMNIAAGSPRLGVSTKDPRGFDIVKWHHLNCHPTKSYLLGALDQIKGFSSLKSSEQDLLRKLAAKPSSSQFISGVNREEIEADALELKKRKLFGAENGKQLEVNFSFSNVMSKYKDASLPPNWKAFDTLIFNDRVFIACGLGNKKVDPDDPFRKPMPGMWRIMADHFNSGKSIDMNQSFYVGDAAGRADDHSDADIKFAQAIGVKFYVPDEYFIA